MNQEEAREKMREIIRGVIDIRVRNNVPWGALMLAAVDYAPPDIIGNIIHEINDNDLRINQLMASLNKVIQELHE